MKSLKKFFALALALALCFVMALPAMATETTDTGILTGKDSGTLKVEGQTGHEYWVYQIYTGNVQKNPENKEELVLSDIKYGVNHDEYDVSATNIVPNSEIESLMKDATFADTLYSKLADKAAPYKKLNENESWSAKVEAGYYLIVDMTSGDPAAIDPDSALVVQLVGDLTVKPKTDTPSSDKKVQQGTDDENIKWEDNAGHEIGESFRFQLTANIPVAQLRSFDKYMIRFNDRMSEGLTFDGLESLVIKNGDSDISLDIKDYPAMVATYSEDTKKYDVTEEALVAPKAGAVFGVTIRNLFDIEEIAKNGEDGMPEWPITDVDGVECVQIVLTYKAHLNENAKSTSTGVILNSDGSLNLAESNKGNLTYTRDPDTDGEGDTPDKEVFVFTFDIDGTKFKDAVADGNKITGAGFTLYPVTVDGAKDEEHPLEFVLVDGRYVLYSEAVFGPREDLEEEDKLVTEIMVDDKSNFKFTGLGVGTYILSETTVPDGYNKTADIKFEISEPTVVENENGEKVVTLHVEKTYVANDAVSEDNLPENTEIESNSDSSHVDVINKKGTLLPSTGGIGTTIFYAVGGVLVVGAGVLLIVKKRLGSKG